MADITIGQYYPANSIIHRLDPRIKLFGTMLFILCLFLANNLIGYLIITVALFVVTGMTKVPFKRLIKGLRGILLILIISAGCNLFFINTGKVLLELSFIKITSDGLIRTCYIAVRLIYLVIGTSVMTLTTKPGDLADGLEKSFGFLKKIRFPVHEMAMMMSLALRFIPTLMEETDKIIKAQKARGADFESGNIFRRIKNLIPILIPLFISAINRAWDLANAMEARCYSGGKRTKLKPLKYDRNDRIAYLLFCIYFFVIVLSDIAVVSIQALSILKFM